MKTGANEMKLEIYDLPCFDSRRSFYGKAKVIENNNGEKFLLSYSTVVCKITNNNMFVRLWDSYSPATMRHINSFLYLFSLDGGGKKWWDSLSVNQSERI